MSEFLFNLIALKKDYFQVKCYMLNNKYIL